MSELARAPLMLLALTGESRGKVGFFTADPLETEPKFTGLKSLADLAPETAKPHLTQHFPAGSPILLIRGGEAMALLLQAEVGDLVSRFHPGKKLLASASRALEYKIRQYELAQTTP